jgi:hypothetical protein
MNAPEDISTNDRPVCADCIGESYLADLVTHSGTPAPCYYCSVHGQTITVEKLSEYVERAINQHYVRTASEPEGYEYYAQRETGDWYRSGEPVVEVVAQMLRADEAIAKDVQEVLDEKTSDWDSVIWGEEQPFSDEAHYEETTSVDHTSISEEYRQFETVIIERARYFSPETRRFLRSLFGQLQGLRTHDGRPVLLDVGPGQTINSFFRARVFQDDTQLERALASPDKDIGPPPPRLGRAGRLNAAGVSLFYGADTAEVALAEVRPPVGSRVVIARFELLRPARLLDIDALKSLLVEGSVFDPEYLERLKHAAFLDSFSRRFTQPVMPDHETFEYIPTQAVADYLANEVEPLLDGIFYASPQSAGAGKNVALFHRSSRVEPRATPEGMTTNVWIGHWTDDGYEIDYTVFEEVPAPGAEAPAMHSEARIPDLPMDQLPEGADTRVPTLRIDLDSVEVRHINAVEVRSQAYEVSRSRRTRDQSPF